MREGALFATLFGRGAGAVLVGMPVSRLVVGQPPETLAEEPAPVVAEAPPPAIVEPVSSAVVLPAAEPPAVGPSATEPAPAPAVERQRRTLVRKRGRPIPPEASFATTSVPRAEVEIVAPAPAEASH